MSKLHYYSRDTFHGPQFEAIETFPDNTIGREFHWNHPLNSWVLAHHHEKTIEYQKLGTRGWHEVKKPHWMPAPKLD